MFNVKHFQIKNKANNTLLDKSRLAKQHTVAVLRSIMGLCEDINSDSDGEKRMKLKHRCVPPTIAADIADIL